LAEISLEIVFRLLGLSGVIERKLTLLYDEKEAEEHLLMTSCACKGCRIAREWPYDEWSSSLSDIIMLAHVSQIQ
jgi:hypothetical protein